MKRYSIILLLFCLQYCASAQTAKDFFNAGEASYSHSNYTIAIENFSKAIEIDPTDTASYNWRANTKEEMKDEDGAIEDYSTSIKIKPGLKAYINRAVIENKLNRMQAAIADCNQALSIKPDLSFTYEVRGCAYMQLHKLSLGMADFEKAISLDKNDAKAYIFRGRVYIIQHKPDKAIADFKKAIALKPDFAEAYERLGSIDFYIGKKSEACIEWGKARSLGSKEAVENLNMYCK